MRPPRDGPGRPPRGGTPSGFGAQILQRLRDRAAAERVAADRLQHRVAFELLPARLATVPPVPSGPGHDARRAKIGEGYSNVALSLVPEVAERVPLTGTAQGVVLIVGTRVPLDTVVDAFNEGRSAEEIALGYPTLNLADVYAVLAYYLRHREDVDAYVLARRRDADALRTRIEAEADARGIRERLLARRDAGPRPA